MKCVYCQGEMVRGSAPLHIDHKDVHISLDNVPAWACAQCGEVCFEEADLDVMQELIRAVDEQKEKLVHSA